MPTPITHRARHLHAARSGSATPEPAERGPLLAVWPEPDVQPSRLLAKVVERYSDPGDLVLADGEAKAIAIALRRRVIASNTANGSPTVKQLRPQESVRLALVTVAGPKTTDLNSILSRLAPGGFVVVLPICDSTKLGQLVQRTEGAGLGYWQHIVAFNAADGKSSTGRARRDILVLRYAGPDGCESRAAVAA